MQAGTPGESVLKRWLALEMGKINDGVVTGRQHLSDLAREDHPSAVTRRGTRYDFDRTALHAMRDRLPERLRTRLRIPIIFYFDSQVADSFVLADPVAFEALQELGELSDQRQMHEGRIWVGRAIAFAIIVKYPTLVQIMMC